MVIAALVAGLVGGLLAGSLHEGPRGDRGPRGKDAVVDDLGVCWDASIHFSNEGNYVSDVNLGSPQLAGNSTRFCGSGQFVPVKPQPALGTD